MPDGQGDRVTDDSFYLLFNPHHERVIFAIPDERWGQKWVKVLDTREDLPDEGDDPVSAGDKLEMEARSLRVLRRVE